MCVCACAGRYCLNIASSLWQEKEDTVTIQSHVCPISLRVPHLLEEGRGLHRRCSPVLIHLEKCTSLVARPVPLTWQLFSCFTSHLLLHFQSLPTGTFFLKNHLKTIWCLVYPSRKKKRKTTSLYVCMYLYGNIWVVEWRDRLAVWMKTFLYMVTLLSWLEPILLLVLTFLVCL